MAQPDLSLHHDHLTLKIADDRLRFHYFWLRDNCPGSVSDNGQKKHESNTLDPKITPVECSHANDELQITWSDGHRSTYPTHFLSHHAYDGSAPHKTNQRLWTGASLLPLNYHDYEAVRTEPDALKAWLKEVEVYGFGLLKNVPQVERQIFKVVDLFGYLRNTNYGALFEVRAEEAPVNLAFTPEPLSVHTDNPYRDPCPSLQLLHCLTQAEQGGISALVDGFNAALQLRDTAPEAFDLLSRQEVCFRYQDGPVLLEHREAIIRQNSHGQVVKVRINNRSLAPLHLPFDAVPQFYEALFAFRRLLEKEENQLQFRMEPGHLVLFDNERVLHGRIGHAVGRRHLQGCYADRDGLLSTLRNLERRGD